MKTPFPVPVFFVAIPITVALMLYQAWVLLPLWAWFIFPVTGLAAPPLIVFTGFLMALRVPFERFRPEEDVAIAENFFRRVVFSVLYPPLVLAIGWVLHQFA